MTDLVRGRVYRALPMGFTKDHYFLVVSNNRRNRALESVLAVRFTTTRKPAIPSIVPASPDAALTGWIVCDDIVELYEDEVKQDVCGLSQRDMAAVGAGLRAALDLP